MKEKYADEYAEELAVYFPQIEQKELKRMTASMTGQLSFYLKNWYRGFSVRSTKAMDDTGRINKFIVARVFGKRHLRKMKKAAINRKIKRDVEKQQ